MGWTFYRIDTLPNPGDIVWCRWPMRERKGQPGDWIRPTLVRDAFVNEDPETRTVFGSVMVSYGTGAEHPGPADDLIIASVKRARELGLHKPTRFSLSPTDKKNLLWCEEYFVAPRLCTQPRGARREARRARAGELAAVLDQERIARLGLAEFFKLTSSRLPR